MSLTRQRSLQTCSGIMGMQICLPVPVDSAKPDILIFIFDLYCVSSHEN